MGCILKGKLLMEKVTTHAHGKMIMLVASPKTATPYFCNHSEKAALLDDKGRCPEN
jgi:hypothetical protein